jgi:hypothetical protein
MLVLILGARIRLARADADPVVNAPEWVPAGDLTSYTNANAGTFARWAETNSQDALGLFSASCQPGGAL